MTNTTDTSLLPCRLSTSSVKVPTPVCRNFMHQKCTRDDCKFLHDPTICFHFWKYGNCKFDTACKKQHIFNNNDTSSKTSNQQKKPNKKNKDKYNNKRFRNTESFDPIDKKSVDMRILLDLRSFSQNNKVDLPAITSKDVVLSPNIFDDYQPYEIYDKLIQEIENCGISQDDLLKLWHGNDKIKGTHLIADDKLDWKTKCPTFNMVINRLTSFFNMKINTTRFNWYKNNDHWKPFHHDKSFIDPTITKLQNFTVAVSFGTTKDAAFEHAKTKSVVSVPQKDSTVYSFGNDTNAIWRHGILQDKNQDSKGRISIIAWGWIDNIV